MKIKGSVEIHVVDSRTDEVKQVIKQNNLITNYALQSLLDWEVRDRGRNWAYGSYSNFYATQISISSSTTEPSIHLPNLTNIIATGYIPSGITSPIWNENTNPPFGQIQNRIDWTGTARTFNSVGLTSLDPNSNQNTTTSALAYLRLDTPCVQGAYDYLDIFYRIQFFNTEGQNFTRRALLDFGGGFFREKRWRMYDLLISACKCPTNDFPYKDMSTARWGNSDQFYDYYISNTPFNVRYEYEWDGGYRANDLFKFKYYKTWELGEAIGGIFNSLLQGRSNDLDCIYTYKPFVNKSSPFQNLFSHSNSATKPFFDSLALATGNGKVILGGSWTNTWPEMYRVTIDKSGLIGESTYKFSVRKHLGFHGNAWSDRSIGCHFRNANTPAFDNCHGWRDENNDVLRWSNTQIVQYDDTGVTLLDVFDGSYKNWDTNTIPALPVTRVRQCAVDPTNQKIYVGCRLTGLWVIDVATNTITQPLTNACYGVDVGRNNVAYVLVDGGLYRSSDWTTPLNFTYAGITDANWSKVYFLKVDPEDVEDRIAFVIAVLGQSNTIIWHRILSPSRVELNFAGFGDGNGVFYSLGSNYGATGWTNPHTSGKLTVTASSVGGGNVSIIVNRADDNFLTNNTPNSWVAFDLGENNNLIISKYVLKTNSGYDWTIRNWKLQGSNDVTANTVTGINAATWVDLDVRSNDTTIPRGSNQWGIFTVPTSSNTYRWFRILQTGQHTSLRDDLLLNEVELYGSFYTPNFPNTTLGPQNDSIRPFPASLDVSDSGSFWAASMSGNNMICSRLYFGSRSWTNFGNDAYYPYYYINSNIYGLQYFYKVSFYKNYLITKNKIVDINGSTINSYTEVHVQNQRSFIIHLEKGICLSSRDIRQLFTDNVFCWENYGWNGSNWELNHAGAKPTHDTEQPLLNGLTVKFQHGPNAPQFFATDYYTQAMCHGLLKDNATTVYHDSAWYSKPAQFDVPVQAGLTVPANPTNVVPPPVRYWRLKAEEKIPGARWYIRRLIFKDSSGNNLTPATGGVASASYSSGDAFEGFDTNDGSIWDGPERGMTNQFIQYTFPNPVLVTSISINNYVPNGDFLPPTSFSMEWSSDGAFWNRGSIFKISGTNDNVYYNATFTYNTLYEASLSVRSDPNFVAIDTDGAGLTNFFLNGQPVSTIYYNTAVIPPGPNEVILWQDGTVRFNSADAGKTFTGSYCWIKN